MGDLEKATRKAQEFRQREQEILDAALILFLEQGAVSYTHLTLPTILLV